MRGWARVFLRMNVQLCHLDSEAEQAGPDLGSSRMDPIDTKYYQSFQPPGERWKELQCDVKDVTLTRYRSLGEIGMV